MFEAAANDVVGSGAANPRLSQLKWTTLVRRLRKKLKAEKYADRVRVDNT